MQRTCILFLLLQLFTLPFCSLFANHYWGGQLSYECRGNDIYRVHWRGIRDCAGSVNIANLTTVEAVNPNCNLPMAVGSWSSRQVTDISPICPSFLSICQSPQGTIGMEEFYEWRDYDFSNVNCTGYRFSMSTLRSGYIDTGPAYSTFYLETSDLDLSLTPCNSSPVFTEPSLMAFTASQPIRYSQAAIDPDGDSLVYSFGPCLQNHTQFVSYLTGYSGTMPLGSAYSVTIDRHNGDVDILPTPGSSFFRALFCIKVEEYRNGTKIGETIRDHLLFLFGGTNQYPIIQPFANLNGVLQVNSDTLFVPLGLPFSFEVPVTDADSADQVYMTWNQNISGMDLIDPLTGMVADTVWGASAKFSWTPLQMGTFTFLFKARDNSCPIDGRAENTLTIVVGNGTLPVSGTGQTAGQSCHEFLFVALPQSGTPPFQYEWTGPGGLSSSPNRFDSTFSFGYSTPGTYPVSLTVTDSAGGQYTWTDTLSALTDLSGAVFTSNSTPYANSWVYLLGLDLSDSTTYLLDSTTTDSIGQYAICLQDSQVAVSVWPDAGSFPNELPAYADSAWVWQDANIASSGFHLTRDITLTAKTPSTGTASLGGTVFQSQLSGAPAENLRILLLNGQGRSVEWTRTDANGQFSFTGLAQDSFFVWVDKPFITNAIAPVIRLDAGLSNRDSLDFILHPTWLEWVLPLSGTIDDLPGPSFQIGPNPFTNRLRICGILPYAGPVRVHLADLEGRVLLEYNWEDLPTGKFELDVHPGRLPSGLCFLSITLGEGVYHYKLLRE